MTDKKAKATQQTAEQAIEGTEAGKIWAEIKDKPINMFALPNQVIRQYCAPAIVEPSKLYLLSTAGSTLPAIETALGSAFTVEAVDKYITVARAVAVHLTRR
jgi:hypothetical protein